MKKTIFLFIAILCVQIAEAQKVKLSAYQTNFENDLRGEMLDLCKWGQHGSISVMKDSEVVEPAVIINENRAEYLEILRDNGNVNIYNYKMRYRRVHLNEEKAVQNFNKINIPVNDPSELVDLRARTISATGKYSREFDENDMKMVMEDGSYNMILAVDGCEKDGELEFYYIVREEGVSEYGKYYFQSNNYCRNLTFTKRVPKNVTFLFKMYNSGAEIKSETVGDNNIYSLELANMPVLPQLDFENHDAELIRMEYVLGYIESKGKARLNTYADFTKNLMQNIDSDMDKSKSDIKKLIKKLKLNDLKSELDKVKTVEIWIKNNIAYNSNSSYKDIKTLLKDKNASKFGLLRLYSYLFVELGIQYEIWTTCDRSDRKFDLNFESYSFLEDVYFYFPKYKRFLDYSEIGNRLGNPPSEILGQGVLMIKKIDLGDNVTSTKFTMGKVPVPSMKATSNKLNVEVTVNKELNGASVHYNHKLGGYENYMQVFFSYTSDPKDIKEFVENQLKQVSSDAVLVNSMIVNENLFDLSQMDSNINFTADYTTSNLIENANNILVLKLGTLIGPQSELYNAKPRTTPIATRFPHEYYRTITLNIPEGYTAKGIEKFNINKTFVSGSDSIGFVSSAQIVGSKLVIQCNEYYEGIQWPLSGYENFKSVINAAADFNKISIILQPK